MRELRCATQRYDWGVVGSGLCRALGAANAARNGANVDDAFMDGPHAELWIGTHPNGMSVLSDTGVDLRAHVAENQVQCLGARVIDRFGDGGRCDVPFLMKILSVAKALSVQAHPDKKLAKELHARDPKNYRDDNHKPEMALCVSERFEAMSGFASAREVWENARAHEELRRAASDEEAWSDLERALAAGKGDDDDEVKGAFKRVFTALMTAEKATVERELALMRTRVAAKESRDAKESLFLRLCTQYPGDVGAFCAFVLNYVTITPGQAIVMAANEPHAYLSGDCVEVMATSDNVVRAGLTPKFRDVRVLCDMLTYTLGPPEILTGDVIDACTRRYVPPFEEFVLDVVACASGSSHVAAARDGPSVWIVHRGACRATSSADGRTLALTPGAALFVDAGESLDVDASEDFVAYVSSTNA